MSFEEQTGGLQQILEGENDDSPDLEKLKGVYKGVIGEKNIKSMDEIIKRQNFFNEKGESLVTILKIVRESAGELHPRAFKKLKDW